MKKLVIIFCFCSLAIISAQAQNPNYPYGISFKTLFMDYQSQNGGSITDFASYHHGFEVGLHKNLTENLNILLPVKVGVVNSHNTEYKNCLHKNVYGADAQVQYMFTKPAAKLIPYVMAGVGGVLEQEGDFNIQIPFGAGLFFHVRDNAYINWQSAYRYSLTENRNNLQHGLGFVYLFGKPKMMEAVSMEGDKEMNMADSDGDGLEDEIDLCPQLAGPIELKGCPDKDSDGIPDYRDDCPAIAGLAIFKGCPDTDGDGIDDNSDECPNMPGVASMNGCPEKDGNRKDMMDSDGDGVIDSMDKCPNVAAVGTVDGCPNKVTAPGITDSDGDGIVDAADKCPNVPGNGSADGCPTTQNTVQDSDGDGVIDSADRCPNLAGTGADGCPPTQTTIQDRDGDGVADSADKCPNSPGIAAFGGCPDSDGDGIDDSRDRCPNTYGAVSSNGCPEIDSNDRSVLELAMRAVTFDSGKATMKGDSYNVLGQIASILNKYPNYNLIIEGHTDNVGSAINNQLLSERRAKACYDYLINNGGLDPSRLTHTGYGESRPISSNDNLEGRKLNRRVVFNLVPR